MSSASLAAPRHAHPDSARIAALSAAIALNLAALIVVMRPMAPEFAAQVQRITAMPITWITPPKEVPPPPTIDLKKLVQPKTVPHTQTVPRPQPVTPPAVPTTDDGSIPAPPVAPTLAPPTDTGVSAAPIEATLAYRATPLKYPQQALRSHLQGQVILKVLVDENGVPQQVSIEKSSGEQVLDRSACDQVLKGWRFEPATVNGHAVRAWARVPVTFSLNEL
ncbi:outer membrane transport energization protein TonB [Dyella jiangningensis]|uniref:energy transducer TonB n=1 Tax=Dyella sp. AtDHG13 TaxID=1938897 RepID=UPI0008921E9C|nr:energy transducer TonB [Dyella sp. AtDHG13]PXV57336.1 outer membrane transport energization protein TonB [Dyella sp. AtDHG13]SDK40539.1 outer membrane transport energization protein TonB [Dyella jiangningensis]